MTEEKEETVKVRGKRNVPGANREWKSARNREGKEKKTSERDRRERESFMKEREEMDRFIKREKK